MSRHEDGARASDQGRGGEEGGEGNGVRGGEKGGERDGEEGIGEGDEMSGEEGGEGSERVHVARAVERRCGSPRSFVRCSHPTDRCRSD